jgi:uncharacterized caspase-like protein
MSSLFTPSVSMRNIQRDVAGLLRYGLLSLMLVFLPQKVNAAKVALVIGNAAYQSRPLDNPVNDARAISAKLSTLGFRVVSRENLRLREIGGMLREFRQQIHPGDEVVVFYAGHGLQVNGINYLPAVDADIQGEEDVPLNSLSINTLLTVLEESKAGIKLLFLDACRDNPFARSFRSAAGGDLGKVGSAPSGTLIHYATRPGSVAADGKRGGNGLYTTYLLKWMSTQQMSVEAMHKKVALEVEQESQGKQEPWSEGQLKGEFYFNGPNSTAINAASPAPAQVGAPAPAHDGGAEVAFWNSVKDSNTAVEFQSYLNRYPNGLFAELARARLQRLQSTPTTPAPAVNQESAQSQKSNQPDPGLLIFKNFLELMMKDK